jgi:ATP-dependent helicase/nuclease subunit A
MSERIIPTALLDVQDQASDPAVSAWVSANAGAGKTHVLAQRVIRLLLDGVNPAKILCLTFTKAAAASMATRVFTILRSWIALDDGDLDRAIAATGARRGSGAAQRARARKMFASALDTPGGLKVQTIHGFCSGLLQQFPFEANVAARFRVMEDVQQKHLIEEIRFAVLLEAANLPDSLLGRALSTAVATATDYAFQTALNEAIIEREKFFAWRDHAGGVSALHNEISAALGIDPKDSTKQAEDALFSDAIIPVSRWPDFIEMLGQGSAADQKCAPIFARALAATGTVRRAEYLSFYFTQEGPPRKNIVTGAFSKKFPAVAQELDPEKARVIALEARRKAIATRDRTVALLTIADEVLQRYRTEKDRRGLLDYADLIAKTRDMLDRVESAWVHYKLDLGIDHVLIDEAQDTSPAQWDIIEKLVAEFFAGAGARGATKRSIFAVGDDKQSIFSFQGAAPAIFADMQRKFETAHKIAALRFEPVKFLYSFRSVPLVLHAVDTVFGQPKAFEGLASDNVSTVHEAVRASAPGVVELWPLVEPQDKEAPEPWDAPFDATSPLSPRAVLARRIAKAVGRWIARREPVGDDDARRPMRPGDILILVRQRGGLFEAVIRALKNAGIAVAGADRLMLTEHIAVMDLLALADAVLLPQDDLALATVLKSPLFGLSEEDLFTLAWNRTGTLRAALREKHPEMAARLDTLAAHAQHATPFAWFADLLGTNILTVGGGRKAFLARLGPEANDALDEFLNLTLDYESREIPSLQGFVAWLRTASAEIKRDMEMARDEVRVMTVHGAKGLEAPVVILADTTTPPAGPPQLQRRLLPLARQRAAPGTPDRLAWVPNKDSHIDITTASRDAMNTAAANEYRRLLYVAMTRAADRLIVCGERGRNNPPKDCWYELVQNGLEASGELTEQESDYGEGMIRTFRKSLADTEGLVDPAAVTTARENLPAWLTHDAPVERGRFAITPSSDALPAFLSSVGSPETRRIALKHGIIAHRLLQSLPNIAPERRRATAETYLQRAGAELPEEDRVRLLGQLLALIDDSKFAQLFAPGSRGEVPIVGRVVGRDSQPLVVTGQVDRLAVTPDTVWIADYKTNRPPPKQVKDVPASYVRQLALYRVLLGTVYPNRTVRAALIWTEVPDLMELPTELLDAAFNAITSW